MNYSKWNQEPHKAQYFIADCEHEGDIRRAEQEVTAAGGFVDGTEWDGHDCGEAWVYFHCSTAEELEKACKTLGID